MTERTARGDTLAIDGIEYAAGLLGIGTVPWSDVAALGNLYAQMASLLKPGVVPVPLQPLLTAALDDRPHVVNAMRESSRPLGPLRALLGADDMRAHVSRSLAAISANVPGRELLLDVGDASVISSDAFRTAHGTDTRVEGAKAAIYLADFLRALADSPVDVVLFTALAGMDDEDGVRTLVQTANHFGWASGVRSAEGSLLRSAIPEVAFWVGEGWERDPSGIERCRASSGLTLVHIKPDSVPERILEALADRAV